MDETRSTSDFRTRRGFLGPLAGSLAAPLIVPARALGRGGGAPPSDRVTFAVIGAGTRGPYESKFYVPRRADIGREAAERLPQLL